VFKKERKMPRTRRNFTAEYKAKIVLELISRNKSVAEVCREYNLKPDLVSRWKSQFLNNAAQVFADASEIDPQQTRIQELERLAGKQSLEIEILKKTLTLLPRAKGSGES
jgi:transposase-like protein